MEEKEYTHTVHLHGLQYNARVVSTNEDGSLEMTAVALNNGQEFPLSRVRQVPESGAFSPAVPHYVAPAAGDEDDDTDEA